mmetsp:Transcript_2166/g.4384  ORF Transcript_2166/g.4384 Transcript_2166/m.4384 type:complete len:1086 (-) Transcript_2166:121-3378(-)
MDANQHQQQKEESGSSNQWTTLIQDALAKYTSLVLPAPAKSTKSNSRPQPLEKQRDIHDEIKPAQHLPFARSSRSVDGNNNADSIRDADSMREEDAISVASSIQTHDVLASVIPGFSLIQGVLEMIPLHDKKALLQAFQQCPEVVREESNPEWFLQRENYNAVAATHRLTKYWDLRVELFQQTYYGAYSPLASPQSSAVLSEREVNLMREKVHQVILPSSSSSSTLVLQPLVILDLTAKTLVGWQWNSKDHQESMLRTIFLARNCVAQNDAAQQHGCIELIIVDNTTLRSALPVLRRTLQIVQDVLPLKMTSLFIAVLQDSDPTLSEPLSVSSIFGPMENEIEQQIHFLTGTSPREIRKKLETEHRFHKKHLPVSLGGKWDGNGLDSLFRRQTTVQKESDTGDSKPAARTRGEERKGPQEDDSSPVLDTSHVVLRALRAMSSPDIEEYEAAFNHNTQLILHETNPTLYLEAEGGNAAFAASKVASYWKIKKQLCGEQFLQPLDTSIASAVPPTSITCLGDGSMVLLPEAGPSGEDCMYIDDTCIVQCTQWRNGLFFALSRLCASAINSKNGLSVFIVATHPQWYQYCVERLFQFTEQAFVIWVKQVHVISHNYSSISRLEPLHRQWLAHFDQFKRGTVKGRIHFHVSRTETTLKSLSQNGYKLQSVRTALSPSEIKRVNSLDLWCAARPSSAVAAAAPTVRDVEEEEDNMDDKLDATDSPSSDCSSSFGSLEESSIRALEEAITLLPEEESSAYYQAKKEVPHLVKKESNPIWYLKFAEYNTWNAAKRLCYYWKRRVDVFQDRAFLPMNQTGEGALTKRDVSALSTGYHAFPPCDKEGRTVILNDASRRRKKDVHSLLRNIFYYNQVSMQNKVTLEKGVVFIILFSGLPVDLLGRRIQEMREIGTNSFAYDCFKLHIIPKISKSRSLLDRALPTLMAFFPKLGDSNKFFHYFADTSDLLESLEKHGLSREGLPESIGGSWSYDDVANWQERQIRMEWDLPLGNLDPGDGKYSARSLSELTEEEKSERKRRYNVIHSRRKRRRDKLESEILEQQVEKLTEEQEPILREHKRLKGLLVQAEELVATL